MKLFLSSLLLLGCLSGYGQTLPNPAPVVLEFEYSTNGIVATNSVYKLYSSPDLSVPLLSWTLVATVTGTNFSAVNGSQYTYRVTNFIAPGERYYYVTASNFWLESLPSNVTLTPPVHTNNTNLKIKKGF